MTTLFIIGNGFDIAHDLPTSYKNDLIKIIKNKSNEDFKAINELYFDGMEDYWSEFESRIGLIDSKTETKLIEKAQNSVNEHYSNITQDPFEYAYEPDDENYGNTFIEVDNAIYQNELDSETIDLLREREHIFEVMNYVDDILSESLIEMIEIANKAIKPELLKEMNFSKNDFYITFNYTKTLELVYDIPQSKILHIHGSNDDLIWGNKDVTDDCSFISNVDVEDPLETNEQDEYPSNLHEYYDSRAYDEEILKEISSILNEKHEKFIKELEMKEMLCFLEKIKDNDIETIKCLGHSFGEVDIPYFEKINEFFNCPNWHVSFHNDNDVVLKNIKMLSFYNSSKVKPFYF